MSQSVEKAKSDSPSKVNNLTMRILTAVVAGGLTVLLMALTPWGVFAFCVLVSVLGLIEYFRISGVFNETVRVMVVITALAVWVQALEFFFVVQNGSVMDVISLISIAMLVIFIPASAIVLLYDKKEHYPLDSLTKAIFGLGYILGPMWAFFYLSANWVMAEGTFMRALEEGSTVVGTRMDFYDPRLPLGILFLLWITDTFAYFGGRLYGKHKLFERISPKKTWEGALSGFASCIALGFLLNGIWGDVYWNWLVIAVIVGIFGQFGDLVESMFKRGAKLKDSGSILPGHGGILDRFDGLLVSMPFIFIYAYYLSRY